MALALLPGSVFAQDAATNVAKAPVLVEIYSTSTCKYDPGLQESVLKRLEEDKNIIVVNCPKRFKNKNQQADRYSRNFCDQRSIGYFRKLMLFTVNTPMVVVDGILEANNNDIDAAINAARSLSKVQKLDLDVQNGVLNVHIPKLEGSVQKGKVVLYAYLPSENVETVIEVDPDVDFDETMKKDLAAGKSVPFVTKKRVGPLKLRPTVGYVHAVDWQGEELSFSYPIEELDPFSIKSQDLSFIVVLHQDDVFGPVMAIGEWKAFSDVEHPDPTKSKTTPTFMSFPPAPRT